MRVAHTLAPLSTDGVPDRHVIIDTEATHAHNAQGEVQTFRLAAAEFIRNPTAARSLGGTTRAYTHPRELWTDVLAFTRNRHRTVVWAHNLAYDLRISRALAELPALGMALTGLVLEHQSSWAAFRGHDRTILCVDLHAWLPASLEKIAEDLGDHRLRFDHRVADQVQLAERCLRDVTITSGAVTQLLDLVRREHLGPWRATGAGQSHAAWRRRFLTHRPFVHDSEHTLEVERRAMWTGRCEAWKHGRISRGGVHEYDLQLAYPHITASRDVPTRLVGETSARHGWQVVGHMKRYAVLAQLQVTCNLELAPCEHGTLIHWPVGRYQTTVWDPELRLLYDHGQHVRVLRCWLYEKAPALQHFSRWLLTHVDGDSASTTPLQRRALKHMARAVIGRCALRYRSWEPYASLPEFGLRLGEMHDLSSGEATELLHVGHELLTLAGETEADDSLPQITGWVMSACRAQLWRLMHTAGLGNLLYVDTDSLIVNDEGARRLDRHIAAGRAGSLEHKRSYRSATILGPRQLQLGRERRLAGVPLSAEQVAPGEYEGHVWRSLRESVARGEGDTVVLERKRWQLHAVDNRRTHNPDGSTSAHRVG